MLLCLREPPRRFLWCWLLLLLFIIHCCCRSSFIFVLHLSMFFIHICFLASSLTLPWTIDEFLHPFYNFSRAYIPEWFASLSFSIIPLFSCRGHYGFDWAFFYPWALFALRSFIGILPSFNSGAKNGNFNQGFIRILFDSHFIIIFMFRTIHI